MQKPASQEHLPDVFKDIIRNTEIYLYDKSMVITSPIFLVDLTQLAIFIHVFIVLTNDGYGGNVIISLYV